MDTKVKMARVPKCNVGPGMSIVVQDGVTLHEISIGQTRTLSAADKQGRILVAAIDKEWKVKEVDDGFRIKTGDEKLLVKSPTEGMVWLVEDGKLYAVPPTNDDEIKVVSVGDIFAQMREDKVAKAAKKVKKAAAKAAKKAAKAEIDSEDATDPADPVGDDGKAA